jgi:hypothetical protein
MATTDASDFVHGGLTHAHVFGTLAVDGKGTVYALWIDTRDMAKASDSGKVFMAVSRDDGESFEKDREILPADVCPCCQLTAFVDASGKLYVGSRQVDQKYRDSTVTVSSDGGRSFAARRRVVGTRWEIEGCPLKPTSIVARGKRVVAAYYTGAEKSRRCLHRPFERRRRELVETDARASGCGHLRCTDLSDRRRHRTRFLACKEFGRRTARVHARIQRFRGDVRRRARTAGASRRDAVAARSPGARTVCVQVAWQQGTEVRAMRWVAAN